MSDYNSYITRNPTNDPSNIVIVGYAYIEDTDYTLTIDEDFSILADGEYEYIRTDYTDICEGYETSSLPLNILISAGSLIQIPLGTISNLFLEPIANGAFDLFFSYSVPDGDVTTHFNIYYSSDLSDPSNPSDLIWEYDGLLEKTGIDGIGKIKYTTTNFENNVSVSFKVIPATLNGSEDIEQEDNGLIVTGIADSVSPSVIYDKIEMDLE